MERSICNEKHRQIDYRLDVQDKRLDDHSQRLDIIEKINSRLEERLDNLIKQLATLNSIMKWFMGLLLGGIVSFFFYAIQYKLIK